MGVLPVCFVVRGTSKVGDVVNLLLMSFDEVWMKMTRVIFV